MHLLNQLSLSCFSNIDCKGIHVSCLSPSASESLGDLTSDASVCFSVKLGSWNLPRSPEDKRSQVMPQRHLTCDRARVLLLLWFLTRLYWDLPKSPISFQTCNSCQCWRFCGKKTKHRVASHPLWAPEDVPKHTHTQKASWNKKSNRIQSYEHQKFCFISLNPGKIYCEIIPRCPK